jgi:hypothetical protein
MKENSRKSIARSIGHALWGILAAAAAVAIAKTANATGAAAVQEPLITSVEIRRIENSTALPLFDNHALFSATSDDNDCSKTPPNTNQPLNVDPSDILRWGKAIWELIRDNGAVANAKGTSSSALPKGVTCWTDLTQWSAPRIETYQVIYKNLYGAKVVNLEFRLIYHHSGSLKGLGRYIGNATVQVAKLDVLWGYIFNLKAEIPTVLNIGTEQSPIAGMQINLRWTVNTRPISLRSTARTVSFFIAGDGRATQMF